MDKAFFKVVNHLTLIILAELLSNKINPTGYINRYGSSTVDIIYDIKLGF